MPFPIIPVLVTAGLGGLGYLLFGPAKDGAGNAPASNAPATVKPSLIPGLPDARRPADLPAPLPAPRPAPRPAPQPLPIPIPPPGVLPAPAPSPLPNIIPPLPNILPIPPPTPVEPSTQTGTVIAPSGVNLRSGPSTSASVLSGLPMGTRVKILRLDSTPTAGAPRGWYQVQAPSGVTGFATAEFILADGAPSPIPNILPNVLPSIPGMPPSPNPLPPPPSSGALTATVLGSPGANLRASPSTSGAILLGLFNGQTVTVLNPIPAPPNTGAPKGWLNVKSPSGVTGWMSAEFLRLNAPTFGDDYGFGDDTPVPQKYSTRIRH